MNLRALAGKIGLDYDKTVEDFCGDVSALKEKIQSFNNDCRIDEFEDAVKEGDNSLIKSIAHKIKKAAEKVGITPLVNAAERVEEVDDSKLKAAADELIKIYNEVVSHIKNEANPN